MKHVLKTEFNSGSRKLGQDNKMYKWIRWILFHGLLDIFGETTVFYGTTMICFSPYLICSLVWKNSLLSLVRKLASAFLLPQFCLTQNWPYYR